MKYKESCLKGQLFFFVRKPYHYRSDLLAPAVNIPVPYIIGYDTRPLLTMPEKTKFLAVAADNNYYFFLEQNAHNEIITVQNTEKEVRLKDVFKPEEILT